MWRKGKKRAEDEGLDEPPRKTLKTTDDSDQIIVCDLASNRKVLVKKWQGKVAVDVREFYAKDGKELPGKKGISLSMDQWKILRDHVNEIDKELGKNN